MLPITLSSMFLVLIALNNTLSSWDPVATLMARILLTCMFMIVITSNYLIKRLQKERDAEKEVALMKSEQTSILESLVKERTLELEQSNKMLAELASKDALTNLPNRRSVDLFVDASFEELVGSDRNIAVALNDVHDGINGLSLTELRDRKVGASIGWTMCTGSNAIVDAFRRADKALYTAKNKGRNCIIRAQKSSVVAPSYFDEVCINTLLIRSAET